MRRFHVCSFGRAPLALWVVLALLLPLGVRITLQSQVTSAAASELFISEYIEGSSNNKALEIYNGTSATSDLSAGGYVIQMYFNGSASASTTINLTGSIAPGNVFVLAQASANATILAQADQTSSASWFNGDDAIVLRKGGTSGTIVDVIGQVGFDPGNEWGSGLVSTQDNTLRRKATVCAGDTNPDDTFDPSLEWDGFAQDIFDGLGSHTATCSSPSTPNVTVEASDAAASETGSDTGTFTITRSGDTTSELSVSYTIGGTASNGGDYTLSPASPVTIPAGASSVAVTVTPLDDSAIEGNETVTLTLGDDSAYDLGSPSSATVTIADDDTALPTVTVQASDAAAAETSLDTGIFTITRSGDTTSELSVSYTIGGTASSGGDYTLSPASPVTIPAGASSVAVTVTPLDDSAIEGNETVTLTLVDAAAYDLGSPSSATVTIADDDTAACSTSDTPIATVQGSGTTSPLVGTTVTVEGVVVGDFQGSSRLNGFFLQDGGDGNPATSDGIFIYIPSANSFYNVNVNVGDVVQVTGQVKEFNALTELDFVSALEICGSATVPAPTPVTLPESANGELEQYEGMLVSIVGSLTVQQNYFLGRYGQLTLGMGGRLVQPTNIYDAGSAEALAAADTNARSLLILDDGWSGQNPNPIPYLGDDTTVRAGDTVSDLVGVLDAGAINSSSPPALDYRLHPTQPPVFTRINARTSAPADVGGNVKVASFNVLNYFTTIDQSGAACFPTGTRSDCRGADSATELDRQANKIVAALAGLNADVVGLIEIENNGDVAASDLVSRLNAQVGTGTYAVISTPAGFQQLPGGDDAIKVGMIYKPGVVTPVGAAVADDSSAFAIARAPLAQTFEVNATGERFSVIVNHFKSKGCGNETGGDIDQGDGQGCFNATRVTQAQALLQFIDEITTASGDPDLLVIGDLNAYGKEDPIQALETGGLIDQLAANVDFPYSYVFDGLVGYLDHALTTASLASQVTGVTAWHINADEPSVIDYNTEFKPQDLYQSTPYRSSDHDPMLVGLNLSTAAQPAITSALPPAGQVGVAYAHTFVSDHTPSATFSLASGTLPPGLTLDPASGVLSGTPTSAGTYPDITVTASNGVTADATQTFSITIAAVAAQPAITSALPPAGQVGVAYTHTFVSDHTPSATFSLASGTLPPGLTLDPASGVLSGTPTSAGTYPDITVTASNGVTADATQTFSITIAAVAAQPAITSALPPAGQVGVAYTHTFVSDHTPSATFSLASGTLPPGLTLDPASGALSGTPTTAGTYPDITVTASNGVTADATQTFSITISADGDESFLVYLPLLMR